MRLFTLIVFAILLAARPAQSAERAWLLEQVTPMGPVHMYLAAHAIRAEIPERGIRIVTKAPDWKVIFINDSLKLKLELPLETFTKHGFVWNYYSAEILPVLENQSKPITYAGLAAMSFTSFDPRAGHLDSGSIFGEKQAPKLLKTELIYTNRILALPPATTKFMRGLYGLALCKDIPLKYYLYGNDRVHPWLLTKSVKEVHQVESSFFDCPSGYGTTTDQWHMILRSGQKDELDDIGNILDAPVKPKK